MILDDDQSEASRSPWEISESRFALLEVFFIFVVFFVHAGWPAPDDSESHYLAIAKHAWNPDWIPDDLLLESTNVHVVFTYSIGWISLIAPLPVFAWAGRVITWVLLAWGWRRLAVAITPRKFFAVLSVALFVTFSEYAVMSREWAVGGLEAKGLAYAFVIFGLERLVRNRWKTALAFMGAATAMHVVVGGWATLAVMVCWLISPRFRPPVLGLISGLAIAAAIASPALFVALRMILFSDPDADVELANRVYVFWRLPHHLWPPAMGWWMIARFGALAALTAGAFCFLLRARRVEGSRVEDSRVQDLVGKEKPTSGDPVAAKATPPLPVVLDKNQSPDHTDEAQANASLLVRVWLIATIISAIGVLLAFALDGLPKSILFTAEQGAELEDSLSGFAAAVFKFYWFRLADVLTPLAAALFGTQMIVMLLNARPAIGKAALTLALAAGGSHLGYLTLYHQAVAIPRADAADKVANFEDWREICRAAADLPGPGGLPRFITPWNSQTFKWYSGRSEVACRKDIPQDAINVNQWWERMTTIYLEHRDGQWMPRGSFTEYPVQELLSFAREYDADYLITEARPAIPGWQPVTRNATYAIYRLR